MSRVGVSQRATDKKRKGKGLQSQPYPAEEDEDEIRPEYGDDAPFYEYPDSGSMGVVEPEDATYPSYTYASSSQSQQHHSPAVNSTLASVDANQTAENYSYSYVEARQGPREEHRLEQTDSYNYDTGTQHEAPEDAAEYGQSQYYDPAGRLADSFAQADLNGDGLGGHNESLGWMRQPGQPSAQAYDWSYTPGYQPPSDNVGLDPSQLYSKQPYDSGYAGTVDSEPEFLRVLYFLSKDSKKTKGVVAVLDHEHLSGPVIEMGTARSLGYRSRDLREPKGVINAGGSKLSTLGQLEVTIYPDDKEALPKTLEFHVVDKLLMGHPVLIPPDLVLFPATIAPQRPLTEDERDVQRKQEQEQRERGAAEDRERDEHNARRRKKKEKEKKEKKEKEKEKREKK